MKKWLTIFTLLLVLFSATAVYAQPSTTQQEELKKALEAVRKIQQVGPTKIKLLDQAQLNLPANCIYIPQPEAGQLTKSMGNGDDPAVIGLVFPKDNNWMVAIRYYKSGYLKDGDAKNFKIDDMFKKIKEGTEWGNNERKQKGIPEIETIGWVDKPQYDPVRHTLMWSIALKDKGQANTNVINYHASLLGREGQLTLSLTTKDNVGQKPIVTQLLAATEFAPGKRYEEYNASTDKTAEYGIAGTAAKKPGFFALVTAFVVEFAKEIIGLTVLGAAIVFMQFFRKAKKDDATQSPPEN